MRWFYWLSVAALAALSTQEAPDVGGSILMILFVLVIFVPVGIWLEVSGCFD